MRTTQVVFGTTAIVVLGSALLTYTAGQRMNRIRDAGAKREHAIVAVEELLSTLQDAETGQRGFVITGDENYLAPFLLAEERLPAAARRFRGLDDIGVSKKDNAAMDNLMRDKLAELRETIQLRRQGGFESALGTIRSGQGKAAMDQIREIVHRIRAEQENQLAHERTAEAAAMRQRTAIFIVSGLLTLVVLSWGYRKIKRAILERNAAAARAQSEREFFSTTLSSIGDCVIVTDTSGRITFMNPIAEGLTGWTEEEAKGRPAKDVFRIINENSRQPVESPVDKVIRKGVIVGLANHTLLIRKNGDEIPIDDSGAPVRAPGGKLEGVVLVFRDFSATRRAQRELLAAKEAAGTATSANVPAGLQRILLVEDHVDSALALARLLKLRGNEVRTVASLEEAIREVETNRFDLLISDVRLSEGSSYDLIERVREHQDIPAIAVTGSGIQSDIERATSAGFDAHLTKPFDLKKLELAIANALQARQQRGITTRSTSGD